MTITTREQVHRTFERALLLSSKADPAEAVSDAMEATAQALCLPVEAVIEALGQEVATCER